MGNTGAGALVGYYRDGSSVERAPYDPGAEMSRPSAVTLVGFEALPFFVGEAHAKHGAASSVPLLGHGRLYTCG